MIDRLPIAAVTDEGPISMMTRRVVGLMFLVALVDSYDQISLAFAAPSIVRHWGIDKSAMGPIFSMQMLGLLLGAILFGYLGDRFGRKLAVISGTLMFGVLSLATLAASSVEHLLVLRLLVGMGVGGVIPNAIVLTNEYSPRRHQVTAVALMFVGYVCGGVGGGLVSAGLIPIFGWQVVFVIGGLVPALMAAILLLFLPESIRFLAASDGVEHQRQASRIAARMRPDLAISEETRIIVDQQGAARVALRELFAGRLKIMTMLLWLLYAANSVTVFGLISWMPMLTESMGYSPRVGAMGTTMLFVGAAIGGVALSRLVDRSGLAPLILIPALAVPFVAGVGMLDRTIPALLYLVALVIGILVFGFQNSLHGIGGSIYPTRVRALGVGWAMSAGKVGAILGPIVAGEMLAAGYSVRAVFIAAAVPLLVSAVGAAMLRQSYDANVHRQASRSGIREAGPLPVP